MEHPELAGSTNPFVRFFQTSYVSWALLAFLFMDLFLHMQWQNLKLDHFASPNRSMVFWAVDDYRKQKQTPDVVLVGSSLLMHVLHGGDAEYLQLPQNEVLHHRACMLEDLLYKKTGVKVHSFAFALAGQMASDAYSLCTTLLGGANKPKVIIYNIAPRDFIDNTLGSPASTEIFKYMSRLGGAKDMAWQARTTLWEKTEYILEKLSATYEHRSYFLYLQQRYAKAILKLIGYKPTDEIHTPFALRRLSLIDQPEDMGTNERICLPNLKASFVDNSDEYRRRYQPFKAKSFLTQVAYLEKLTKWCKQEGIELTLVNMPLTDDNIKLLEPGVYEIYMRNMKQLAADHNLKFIDLQDSGKYDKSLYCDTAHMNGKGGLKFFQALADKLTNGSRIAVGNSKNWQ